MKPNAAAIFVGDAGYTETLLMVRLGIAGLKLPPIGIPKANTLNGVRLPKTTRYSPRSRIPS